MKITRRTLDIRRSKKYKRKTYPVFFLYPLEKKGEMTFSLPGITTRNR